MANVIRTKIPTPKAAAPASKAPVANPNLSPAPQAPERGKRALTTWPLTATLLVATLCVSVFTVLNCYELGLIKGHEQLLAKKVADLQAQLAGMKAAAETAATQATPEPTRSAADPADYVSFTLPSDAKTLGTDSYDLGTAVTDPVAEYVPERSLDVSVVDAASVDKSGCFVAPGLDLEAALSQGMASTSEVSYGSNDFCLFEGGEAGAGSRDAQSYYTLKVGDRYVVFAFDTHYASCETIGVGAPKCVGYDPARDDALYPKILETVKPNE